MRRHDKIALVSNDDAIATRERERDSIYIRNFCSLTANKRQATCIIRVVNSPQSRGRDRDAFLRLLFAHSGERVSPLACKQPRPGCSLTPILNTLLIRITFPQIEQNEKTDHRRAYTRNPLLNINLLRDTCVKHRKFREENNLC